jgi:hypothetical protein
MKKEHPEVKEWRIPQNKKFLFGLISLVVIIILANLVLFIPFKYERYVLYTQNEKVQYNAQESYQETVNYDNCDSGPSCVCSARGGFLWLTCKQCSCTKQRTVVRERIVSILKEKTVEDSATLFQTLTKSRISEDEARQTAQTLLNFLSQKGLNSGKITDISKNSLYWQIEVSSLGTILIDTSSGKIEFVGYLSNPTSFDSYLKSINAQ